MALSEKEIWVEDKKLADKLKVSLKKEDSGQTVRVDKYEDLKKIQELEKKGVARVFLECGNWKVIPLENVIAHCKKIKVIAVVSNAEEAKLALETLEKGSAGVLIKGANESEVKKVQAFISSGEAVEFVEAEVISTKKLPAGARSCVDTSEVMSAEEGALVGSSSSALVLMQAEVNENPHVNTRPFRINAGALSLYVLCPEDKTRYLNEVKAGDEIMIASRSGKMRKATVVRNKIEWRPMLLIEARAPNGRIVKTIAQDAETIRIMTKDGSKSVADLKEGDKILAKVDPEMATHFGKKVEERIIEQ